MTAVARSAHVGGRGFAPFAAARSVLTVAGMHVSTPRPLPIGNHLKHDAAGLVKRGEKGPAVAELQRALAAAGAHVKVDGVFGAKTEAAVRDFQRRSHVEVDGVVGPRTLRALQRFGARPVDPTAPPHSENGKSAEWSRYAAMVRKAGGQVNPGGKPTVLGIRKGNGATSRYADEFVVLLKNGKVKHFAGSTRPGQSSSSLSPDVNGDGVGDVAMLRPGNYLAVPNGLHHGESSYSVRPRRAPGTDRVLAYRDLNHDGFYSASEKAFARRNGVTATQILFHVGRSNPSSIGCMNLTPSNVDAFVRSVGGSGGSFSYTLVER